MSNDIATPENDVLEYVYSMRDSESYKTLPVYEESPFPKEVEFAYEMLCICDLEQYNKWFDSALAANNVPYLAEALIQSPHPTSAQILTVLNKNLNNPRLPVFSFKVAIHPNSSTEALGIVINNISKKDKEYSTLRLLVELSQRSNLLGEHFIKILSLSQHPHVLRALTNNPSLPDELKVLVALQPSA
jgi:hypothetical protein